MAVGNGTGGSSTVFAVLAGFRFIHSMTYEDESFQPPNCRFDFAQVTVCLERAAEIIIFATAPIGLQSQVDNANVKWIKSPDMMCKFWETSPPKDMYNVELWVEVKGPIVGAAHMDIFAGDMNAVEFLSGGTRFEGGNKELAHGDALSDFDMTSRAIDFEDSFVGKGVYPDLIANLRRELVESREVARAS